MKREEYKKINEEFLADKALESGVEEVGDGVFAKSIKKGKGSASPRKNSVFTVHYTGKLINGKKFDSSRGQGYAPAFRLNQLITGWQIALQKMHVGDVWEIYVPSKHGYGSRTIGKIPAFSTLVFEIELIAIG